MHDFDQDILSAPRCVSYNLNVVIVEECTFDRGQASHAINLFDINAKYADVISTTDRFESIFATLNIEHLLLQISKKTIYGTPTELNYAAMIFAMVARIIE